MDTEKLYDRDAFLKEFDAVVTDCRPGKGDTYLVTLDRTAFYPEGGGQSADHGDQAVTWLTAGPTARRCWTSRSGTAWCSTPATGP